MIIRLFRPDDAERVKQIFAKQGVVAHLPLPGEDPSTLIALVGEEDGEVKAAMIGRLTVEAHLVIMPDGKNQIGAIKRLKEHGEGALLAISQHMRSLGLAGFDDIVAFVPKTMTKMQLLLEYFGFVREPETFQGYYKKIGY